MILILSIHLVLLPRLCSPHMNVLPSRPTAPEHCLSTASMQPFLALSLAATAQSHSKTRPGSSWRDAPLCFRWWPFRYETCMRRQPQALKLKHWPAWCFKSLRHQQVKPFPLKCNYTQICIIHSQLAALSNQSKFFCYHHITLFGTVFSFSKLLHAVYIQFPPYALFRPLARAFLLSTDFGCNVRQIQMEFVWILILSSHLCIFPCNLREPCRPWAVKLWRWHCSRTSHIHNRKHFTVPSHVQIPWWSFRQPEE